MPVISQAERAAAQREPNERAAGKPSSRQNVSESGSHADSTAHPLAALARPSKRVDRALAWYLRGSMIRILLIVSGLFVAIFLLMGQTVIAQRQARQEVLLQDESMISLNALMEIMLDAETGQRGFLLTGNAAYLDPYQLAKVRLDPEVSALQRLSDRSSDDEQEHIARARQLIRAKIGDMDRTIELARAGRMPSAIALVEANTGEREMNDLRRELSWLRTDHGLQRQAAFDRVQALENRLLPLVALLGVGMILLVMVALRGERHRAWAEAEARQLAELRAANDQTELLARELNHRNGELRRAGERVAEELALARSMQQALLPQIFPDRETWDLSAAMYPARELGGDFYDYLPLAGGRYGMLVADVSGKGVGAAFFMAVARTVILDLALSGLAPDQVLAKANDILSDRNPMELFVTCCYAVFDPTTGELSHANAGHHPPILRRASNRAVALPSENGIALGVLPGQDYPLSNSAVEPGEAVLFYTDGITEAFNRANEAYGDIRLQSWLERTSHSATAEMMVRELVNDVAKFVDGEEASDDLTCLVLRQKPGAHSMPRPPSSNPSSGGPEKVREEIQILHRRLDSRLEEIAFLARAVEQALPDRPDLAYVANLCLEELITNTILHGFDGEAGHDIDVYLHRTPEWLEIMIKDDAPKFDPFEEAPIPDLGLDLDNRKIGGLGVHIVKAMMDSAEAHYDGTGNLIVLLKAVQPSDLPDN